MSNHLKPVSSRHGKNLNFYKWGIILCLFLAFISSSVLVYQQWNIRNKLQKLEKQAQQEYLLQEIDLISIANTNLVNHPKIHAFFTDLLRNYANKFAKNKNLDISHLPLKFAGFYHDENISRGYGEMGHCFPEQEKVKIELNYLYLLNKFGHDQYITSNPQAGDYSYLEIGFAKMMGTCAHELAHYLQLVKHGKSSCESDLKLNNGNYDRELAKEHEKWTTEIYGMISNFPEYSDLESRWKEIS